MTIKDIFTFHYGDWEVYYKLGDEKPWKKLRGKNNYWYADPMLINYKGKILLFTEAFNKISQCGHIAVSELKNGLFTVPYNIIINSFHMSYPCTFLWNDKLYMIPETSQNRTLEVYSPKNDIMDKWERVGILKNNCRLVDSTILDYENRLFLIGYEERDKKNLTHIYEISLENFSLKEIDNIPHELNLYRPAGNIIVSDNKYYKPCQKNGKLYGESMRIMEISPSKGDWIGETIDQIDVTRLKNEDDCFSGTTRTHTLGYVDGVIVVDTLREYNSLFAPIMIITRKIRNVYFKLRNNQSGDCSREE